VLAVVEAEDSTDNDGITVGVGDGSDDPEAVATVLTDGAPVIELDTEGLLVEVVLPV